jgi:hypothetical protein
LTERGSNSVVECQLPKLDVAGSTPVSRSNFQTWKDPVAAFHSLSCDDAVFELRRAFK